MSAGEAIREKMAQPCPIDGCMCSVPYFRRIGKSGSLKARGIPHSMRVKWGRMGGRGNRGGKPGRLKRDESGGCDQPLC